MRILLNHVGIAHRGWWRSRRVWAGAEVTVVAPERDRSGASNSLSLV